jgi:hypothetical protein
MQFAEGSYTLAGGFGFPVFLIDDAEPPPDARYVRHIRNLLLADLV